MREGPRAPSLATGDGARLQPVSSAPWPSGCDPSSCPLLHADRRALAYLHAVAQRTASLAPADADGLTEREREVLDALCRDKTCEQIALELGRSVVTVRNHVQHILRKFAVHSIPEAVARYLLLPVP